MEKQKNMKGKQNICIALFLFLDDSAESEDPGFINPDSGNFTITNELLKIKGAGDSRWIK